MKGGVGRYTSNLVRALRQHADVVVVCNKSNEAVDENIHNLLTPGDRNNSDAIRKIVRETRPDVVHVQYEVGMYEISKSMFTIQNLNGSTLKEFYLSTDVPTVTTIHSIYPLEEYMAFVKDRIWKKDGRFSFLPLRLRAHMKRWMLKRHYNRLTKIKDYSDEIINLSKSVHEITGRGSVVYHGAEPSPVYTGKQALREEMGLPSDEKLLLAFGHILDSKGFDILNNLQLPDGWKLVIKQTTRLGQEQSQPVQNAINLNTDYMDDQNLSKLFFACDAMIFTRKLTSVSGVLFDSLAHGLPFVATNLAFFREFAEMGLGVVAEREADSLSNAILRLAQNYDAFAKNVERFKPQLKWNIVASQHMNIYSKMLN